jgi:hypothetical protein
MEKDIFHDEPVMKARERNRILDKGGKGSDAECP